MSSKKAKNKGGRPSTYSQEIADAICLMISSTDRGLNSICKDDNMPAQSTVYLWLIQHKEFSEKYTRARERQADLMAEQIIEIADDTSNDTLTTDEGKEYANSEWINRSRLRVDARKWLASKLAPKKYGDKVEVEHSGEIKTISEKTNFKIKSKSK